MYCMLIIYPLSLVILAGTCLSDQPLLWTCPESTDNKTAYFPNIAFDENSLANSVRGSPYLSGLYVYRFEPVINDSCNSIPLIEFCYEISSKINNIEMTILLGSIDSIEPNGTSFMGRVFTQVAIDTTVKCNLILTNDSVCCQSERINVTLSTQVLQQINAFGIEFPDQTFLEHNDSQNMVKTFVATGLDFLGFVSSGDQEPVLMLQGNGCFMNLNLRFLRFIIESEEPPNSQSSNIILVIVTVLPTIGGLMIFLLIITVLIFVIRWRKWKKMKLDKDPQKAFDNANC